MRCGIMTFHRAINYGAVLQAYALRRFVIENYNVDCDVIDYRAESIEKMYAYPRFSINPKALVKKFLAAPKRKKFESFLYTKLQIGKSVTREQLEEESEKYDLIITGSDQVWGKSRIGVDHSYFLDFVADTEKKASYAASMGAGTIDAENSEKYRTLLETFAHISVREHEAKVSLEQLLHRPVEESIDPTLLLNREKWQRIVPGKFAGKKYVLIYMLTNSDSILSLARKIARERNLVIFNITDAYRSESGIRNLRGLGPEEWIDAFLNASYIVTNSFHGTAFAINFHVDFNTEVSKGISKRGTRITDLLKLAGLEDRLLDGEPVTDSIDFSSCDAELRKQRVKAQDYLRRILN